MQSRCIWCLNEIYMPAVASFSGGYASCKCGHSTVAMSDPQWRAILKARNIASPAAKAYDCVTCDIGATDLSGLLAHLRGAHFPFTQTDNPEDDEW